MAGVLDEWGLHVALELLPSSRVHDPCRQKHVVAMPIYSIVFHHEAHRNAGCGDQHVHTVDRPRGSGGRIVRPLLLFGLLRVHVRRYYRMLLPLRVRTFEFQWT